VAYFGLRFHPVVCQVQASGGTCQGAVWQFPASSTVPAPQRAASSFPPHRSSMCHDPTSPAPSPALSLFSPHPTQWRLQLHQEVQATMYQLHAIRSELQGGMNIFNPGYELGGVQGRRAGEG
jgi:hypothetical protein